MSLGIRTFREWRRRAAPPSEPARIFPRAEWTAPPVAAEYLSLHRYLEHRYASTVVLTFDQIEMLLGLPLPAPACREPEWWTTAAVPHSSAWTAAGRTALPNLQARTVTFERNV